MPIPDIHLGKTFGNAGKLLVLAVTFGPLALGVAQCSADNDYDAWEKEAWDSYLENTGATYKWEIDRVRDALEFIGDRLPDFSS